MKIALKSALIAAAMLLPALVASAQAPKPHKLEINQILGLNKADAAIYEISARLDDGSIVVLRMNAFVAQDLSRQLGNFDRK
jgi:hypothetical protein